MSGRRVGLYVLLSVVVSLSLWSAVASSQTPNDFRNGVMRGQYNGPNGGILFTVPAGQRFVLTDFHFAFGATIGMSGSAATLTLSEGMTTRWVSHAFHNSAITNDPIDVHWQTGIVFSPSSSMYLVQDENGSGSYDWIVSWSGYLTSATVDVRTGGEPSPRMGISVSPNPAGGPTLLQFAVARDQHATVSVFDVTGRQVRTLWNGKLSKASYSMPWDGRSDDGTPVRSGQYFVRVKTDEGDIESAKFTKLD